MHTKESLDALRLKGQVEEIAEGLGLSTEGTRDEITERILSSQVSVSEPVTETEEAPAEEQETEDNAPEEPAAAEDETPEDTEEVEEVRARNEEGQFEPDDPDTQLDEAYDPPAPRAISEKAKKTAIVMVATYLGQDGVDDELEEKVVTALEEGKQPCVVKGSGNVRFAVKVFSDPFDKNDLSKDVVPKTRGCVYNVARSLANIRLYPGE